MFPDGSIGLLNVLDLAAAVAFAITGSLVASRKQLDVLGFMWLAVLTGVGGGTIRDLILGVPVFWAVNPSYLVACLLTAVAIHFIAHLPESRYRYILWFDAFGMALVTVAGTAKGLDAGAGPLVAVVMGVLTAAAGGIIRDTVGQEPSIILKREIYVAAAVGGACSYVALAGFGGSRPLAAVVGFGVALTLRLLAIRFNWTLPAYKSQPARTHASSGDS